MKLLPNLRRRDNPPEEETFFPEETIPVEPGADETAASESADDGSADDGSADDGSAGRRRGPLGGVLSRLRPRREQGRHNKREKRSKRDKRGKRGRSEDEGDAVVAVADDDLAADDELKDILLAGTHDGTHENGSRHSQEARGRLLGSGDELPDADDRAQKRDAQPIAFDNTASTVFETAFRWLLVLALIALIILTVFGVYQIQRAVSSDASPEAAPSAEQVGGARGATGPSGQAGDLAEDFATAYLTYDPTAGGGQQQAAEDYLNTLQPYLHPSADPALFEPTASGDSPGTEVRYASTSSVAPAPGEERYRVSVNTQLEGSDTGNGGDDGLAEGGRILDVYVSVPADGGTASVLAPPRITEQTAEPSRQPGVFGYQNAQALEEPAMERTVADFLNALYASPDLRPLVKEQMDEDASVERFPPEDASYDGIERAAVYWRDDRDEAEAQGYSRLYDLEVYVATTDEATGVERTDSWALTVGQLEEGGYKITQVS